jgi:hypothetical protein
VPGFYTYSEDDAVIQDVGCQSKRLKPKGGRSLNFIKLERLNPYVSILIAIQTIVAHSGVGMDIA